LFRLGQMFPEEQNLQIDGTILLTAIDRPSLDCNTARIVSVANPHEV
jgi:hypothetical protein